MKTARVSFVAADAKEWQRHWSAFSERLSVALPAETAMMAKLMLSLNSQEPWAVKYHLPRQFSIFFATLAAAALAAILAAWAWFPWAGISLGTAWVGAVSMFVAPLWPDPEADRQLILGPPLPPLEIKISAEDAGFVTPETTIETMIKAAAEGDEKTFRRGMSRVLAAQLKKEGDHLDEPLRDFGRIQVVAVHDRSNGRARVEIRRKDNPDRQEFLPMIFEDGFWRLASPAE